MKKESYPFDITVYDSIDEMNLDDAALLREARLTTKNAYAPYSHFNVGAFAKLVNGETISGTNQENASYPAGICAERTLMATAAVLYPGVAIETMAISYHNLNGHSNKPVSPCGICRQTLVEFQKRTSHPIRIILSGMEGEVQIIENSAALLPLGFTSDDMK
jgi:cytidine deaminase